MPGTLTRRAVLGGAAGIAGGLALARLGEHAVGAAPPSSTPGCTALTNPHEGNLLDDATAYVDSIAGWVPGAAIAAIDLIAGVSGTYGTGYANLAGSVPFTPSTVAIIDSVTKQFT